MSWLAIGVSAALGALGAVLGVGLVALFRVFGGGNVVSKPIQGVAVVAVALATVQIGRPLVVPKLERARTMDELMAEGRRMLRDEAAARAFAEEMIRLVESPDYLRWLSAPERRGMDLSQARAAGAQLAARGMPRLPIEELNELMRLRGLLAAGSRPLCSALWEGVDDVRLIYQELARLPLEDIRLWFRISVHAMLLEARAAEPQAPPTAQAWEALIESLAGAMGSQDRTLFSQGMSGQALTPEQACDVIQAMHAAFPRLTNRDKRLLAQIVIAGAEIEGGPAAAPSVVDQAAPQGAGEAAAEPQEPPTVMGRTVPGITLPGQGGCTDGYHRRKAYCVHEEVLALPEATVDSLLDQVAAGATPPVVTLEAKPPAPQ